VNAPIFCGTFVVGGPGLRYFEKSERNVYDALELVFEALEAND
jgi:hypothetical protein